MATYTLKVDDTELLTKANPGDTIEVKLPDGGHMLATVQEVRLHKTDIVRQKFPHLQKKTITLSEAATKYNVPRGTVEGWVYRNNYLAPVGDSYPMIVMEADVAACAEIYHQRRAEGSKAPLFDDEGYIYDLKRPDVAAYRRQKKN